MNTKFKKTIAALIFFLMIFSFNSCLSEGRKEVYETREPEESAVEFECDISTIKNISNTDSRFSENVSEWIAECDKASTSSTSVFVLKQTEEGGVYNYLIYRRDAECAFNTYTETLKNSKKEFLNICFADKTVNEEYLSDSLTFVRYVGVREPELNILSYNEDGSVYLGYIIKTVKFKLI